MRRKERPFSDSQVENRGRVNDLVQLGDQGRTANTRLRILGARPIAGGAIQR